MVKALCESECEKSESQKREKEKVGTGEGKRCTRKKKITTSFANISHSDWLEKDRPGKFTSRAGHICFTPTLHSFNCVQVPWYSQRREQKMKNK
jgi:hypothetical protein